VTRFAQAFPLLAISALLCGPARADDSKEARALAEKGEFAEAAQTIGGAIRTAQKKNDLVAEQQLWALCREIFKDSDVRTVWAALIEKLDSKRGGAFVSAHLLAERLVYACIENDDETHLPAATGALAARAKAKGAGRHVALVLRLAEAVAAKGAGAADVCAEAAKQGWPELAGMAAIAVFQGKQVKEGDAKRAEDAVVAAMIAANDPGLAMAWAQPIKRRLRANAPAVSAVTRVMQEIGAITVQMLGGTDAGGGSRFALANAWKRLGSRKPIATLARRDDLLLEQPFEDYKKILKAQAGLKIHGHGGVHLGLNRYGVTVRLLDFDGTGSAGDDADVPGPFDLVHRLAPGETWVLTKRGVEIR